MKRTIAADPLTRKLLITRRPITLHASASLLGVVPTTYACSLSY